MTNRIDVVSLCILLSFALVQNATLAASGASADEVVEFREEFARITAMKHSLSPELDKESFDRDPKGYMKQVLASQEKNNLGSYEKFADEILAKWKSRNPEFYVRLAIRLCGPLSSGSFKDRRCYDVARKYALSALEKRDKIPLELELKLTGYVMTNRGTYYRPTRPDYARHRPKDVEVRLHAWKRLLDAIDPTWDPNETLTLYAESPKGTYWQPGYPAERVKDPALRAEYEASIKTHREKSEAWSKQYGYRSWLKRFPRTAEKYIVGAYSEPPFNLAELKQFLETHPPGEKVKNRILEKVKKGIADYPNKPRFYKTKDKKSSSE